MVLSLRIVGKYSARRIFWKALHKIKLYYYGKIQGPGFSEWCLCMMHLSDGRVRILPLLWWYFFNLRRSGTNRMMIKWIPWVCLSVCVCVCCHRAADWYQSWTIGFKVSQRQIRPGLGAERLINEREVNLGARNNRDGSLRLPGACEMHKRCGRDWMIGSKDLAAFPVSSEL